MSIWFPGVAAVNANSLTLNIEGTALLRKADYLPASRTVKHARRYEYKQGSQCTYKRNIEAGSHNHCYCGKVIRITYSECVFVALVIQNAVRMHRILVSCVVFPFVQDFFTLSHEPYDYGQKFTKHKICYLIFSTTFVRHISHSKNKWARYGRRCLLVFMWSVHYSSQILLKLQCSWKTF